MLTKDEAVQTAWRYFERHGIKETRKPHSVKLLTRAAFEIDPLALELKKRRPEAWQLLDDTFRDRWCILFETGFRSPAFDIVNVDAENGEVTIPPVL